MRAMIVGAAFLLNGCAGPLILPAPAIQTAAPTTVLDRVNPVALSPADIATIQAGTRQSLKDPDSAKFGMISAGTDAKGQISVCLMVNARNSYGGYTGMKPHMGILFRDKKPAVFGLVPDDGRFPEHRDTAIYKVCNDQGLPLS